MNTFRDSKLKIFFFTFLFLMIQAVQLWASEGADPTQYAVKIERENIKKALVECVLKVEDS